MRPLPRPRQARFVARLMALFWLFSLAAGVANACVLATGRLGAHLQSTAAGSSLPTVALHRVAQEHRAAEAAPHDPQPDTATRVCKQFCDSAQATVAETKTVKAPDVGHAAAWTAPAAAWRPAVAMPRVAASPVGAAPPRRLAVAIQFLRLTL